MPIEAPRVLTLTISRNVRALMAANGVTQVQMARELGVAQSAISNRLRGVTPWDTNELEDVSRILRVRPETLLVALLPHQDSNLEPVGWRQSAGGSASVGHPAWGPQTNRIPDMPELAAA